MLEVFKDPAVITWLIVALVLIVIEAITVSLVSIWFAIGSLFSLLTASIKLPVITQIIVFILVSGILLLATKPIVKKMKITKKFSTNADRIIGETGIVIQTVDNVENKGQVKIGGLIWAAKSINEEVIEKDCKVKIIEISGVKVIVEKI